MLTLSVLALLLTAPVEVAGARFELAELQEGGIAFSNRAYVFEGLPAALRGLRYTRLQGGVTAVLRLRVHQPTTVYLAHGPSNLLADPAWVPQPALAFRYRDGGRTSLQVLRRDCPAGLDWTVPQVGWTGTMVLAADLSGSSQPLQLDLSSVPGKVIAHLPASAGVYVGSPTLAVLPDGRLLASHDTFGRGEPVFRMFESRDQGATWWLVTELPRQWWTNLFWHRGALYAMGVCATVPGRSDLVIRRYDAVQQRFSEPRDAASGLLRVGRYHTAPMPLVEHQGWLWRAVEDQEGTPRQWPQQFRALLLAAPAQADLLQAANWQSSPPLASDPAWLPAGWRGWLEGNAVVTPAGTVANLLRVDRLSGAEKAALLTTTGPGQALALDPSGAFVDFPGGAMKFSIRFDPVSRRYWSLTNPVPRWLRRLSPGGVRNVLALVSSADLRVWQIHSIELYHPDPGAHGFQYPDFQIVGDDLLLVSRTAYDDGLGGAHNAHDANLLTFHRLPGFRTRRPADSTAAFEAARQERGMAFEEVFAPDPPVPSDSPAAVPTIQPQ
ncbi:MAG: hypothetical protein IT204_11985 [Fimbriimonadaceae bacterium]|nr:hypothetical protein [Fimbriimonadaceae bacterium]